MKNLPIPSCDECPHLSVNPISYKWVCKKKNRKIVPDVTVIPSWCPLEDAEQKDDKNENNITIPPSNLEQSAGDASLGAKKAPRQNTPVSIHIHSIRHRLTDADGISAKAVIDGLVLAGILQDDSPEFIKQVTFSQEKGDEEQTIITLKTAEEYECFDCERKYV